MFRACENTSCQTLACLDGSLTVVGKLRFRFLFSAFRRLLAIGFYSAFCLRQRLERLEQFPDLVAGMLPYPFDLRPALPGCLFDDGALYHGS